MAYVNSLKFLPGSAVSASAITPVSNDVVNPTKLLPGAGEESKSVSTVAEIITVYTKKVNLKEKTAKEQEKAEENLERKAVENRLEAKEEKESEKDFGLKIPGKGLIDKVLRFIGFTALGFIIDKITEYLPTFENLGKTLQPIIDGIAGFIKIIGGAAITFVERGYAAVDTVRNAIGDIGGEGAQETFDSVLKNLNIVLNGAIIAAMIGLSTRPGGGVGKGLKQGTTAIRGVGAGAGAGVRTTSASAARRYATRFGRGAAERRFGADAVRGLGGRFGRGRVTNLARAGAAKVLGKSGLKAAAKIIKPVVGKLPIIGGLLEFAISWATGDPVGGKQHLEVLVPLL